MALKRKISAMLAILLLLLSLVNFTGCSSNDRFFTELPEGARGNYYRLNTYKNYFDAGRSTISMVKVLKSDGSTISASNCTFEGDRELNCITLWTTSGTKYTFSFNYVQNYPENSYVNAYGYWYYLGGKFTK